MRMKRIIASIFVRDGLAVQSLSFDRFLPIGKPEVLAEFFSAWGADEIVLLDISATKNKRTIDPQLVERVAARSFVPLAVGGGIRTREDINCMLKVGADKVCLNSIVREGFEGIEHFAAEFGAQCLIASVDYQLNSKAKRWEVYDHAKKESTGEDFYDYIKKLSQASIGEILLQNVERDGSLKGFDLESYQKLSADATLPIIALSGAGHSLHFKELFEKTSITSAAAGNMFAYTEHSITSLKANLKKAGMAGIRLDEHHSYLEQSYNQDRLKAPREDYLENLLFEKLEKEVI